MAGWYSRSVFFVTNLTSARRFYIEELEFTEAWAYQEHEETIVAQVNRGDCEIMLAIDAERAGKSRVFIAIEKDELAALREQINSKSLAARDGWWGYPVIEICDPDGNELLFPLDEAN